MKQILNTHHIHLYKRDATTTHQGKIHFKEAMRNISNITLMSLTHLTEMRPKLTALNMSKKHGTITPNTVVQKNS